MELKELDVLDNDLTQEVVDFYHDDFDVHRLRCELSVFYNFVKSSKPEEHSVKEVAQVFTKQSCKTTYPELHNNISACSYNIGTFFLSPKKSQDLAKKHNDGIKTAFSSINEQITWELEGNIGNLVTVSSNRAPR